MLPDCFKFVQFKRLLATQQSFSICIKNSFDIFAMTWQASGQWARPPRDPMMTTAKPVQPSNAQPRLTSSEEQAPKRQLPLPPKMAPIAPKSVPHPRPKNSTIPSIPSRPQPTLQLSKVHRLPDISLLSTPSANLSIEKLAKEPVPCTQPSLKARVAKKVRLWSQIDITRRNAFDSQKRRFPLLMIS